jgi:hypothetical protein
VDIGREGKLYLSLVQNGLMSRKRYFAMLGLDEESETNDMIETAVRIKARCDAAGISVAEIIPPTYAGATIQIAQDQAGILTPDQSA